MKTDNKEREEREKKKELETERERERERERDREREEKVLELETERGGREGRASENKDPVALGDFIAVIALFQSGVTGRRKAQWVKHQMDERVASEV